MHILLVSQVYPPDSAAVGQHMADVAEALADRGHAVTVLTSDRGYDDPRVRYPRQELRHGVSVRRLPLTSFGKGSIASRVGGGLSLVLQAIARGTRGSFDTVLLTTSPPMGGLVGVALAALRGLPFDYWLMDLNPDQAVELGHARPGSTAVRVFDQLNRSILRRARHVIAPDRSMAERFHDKAPESPPPTVIPVWAPAEVSVPTTTTASAARTKLGLQESRVVMYAGNHSVAHPLDGLVAAARARVGDPRLAFVFMGGGVAKVPIDGWIARERPTNVISLPYQPLDQVTDHLAMADVHVVAVGPKTVGIVHPSKIYGALAAARPILVIGPRHSPAALVVAEHRLGWVVEHDDPSGLDEALDAIASASQDDLNQRGARAWSLATGPFSRRARIDELADLVEGRATAGHHASGTMRPR